MVKLMVPVVRDIISERTGIPSAVGTFVEVVKKIPRYSLILVSVPGIGAPRKFPVREDLYLVNAPKTRWMNGPVQCEEGIVMFEGYVGNDICSAEELGV